MKITITGTVGEGKSTIAKYLEHCLAFVGIYSEVDDEDLSDEWHDHNDDRLAILEKRGLKIDIKTICLKTPLSEISPYGFNEEEQ